MCNGSLILFLLMWTIEGKTFSKRIYGGHGISIERVPYYVQVLVDPTLICGGSILLQQVVLTAAHCVEDPYQYHVIAGSDRESEGIKIAVEKVVLHPKYGAFDTHLCNDVGLLILRKQLKYSTQIQPILIPNGMTQPLAEGTQILVVGLGFTGQEVDIGHLQGVSLPVISAKSCYNYLKHKNATEISSQFCLGNLTVEGRDACFGDSGGPAVYNGMQYGIVSYGRGCGIKGNPGVYSNLITLSSWVRQSAKRMGFRNP